MSKVGAVVLAILSFSAGYWAAPTPSKLSPELLETMRQVYCDNLKDLVYMDVDQYDDSVTVLTPLPELCGRAKYISLTAFDNCLEIQAKCGEDAF